MMNGKQRTTFDLLKGQGGVWKTPGWLLLTSLGGQLTKRELADAVSYLEGQGLAQRKRIGGDVHYRWIPGTEPEPPAAGSGKADEPVKWNGRTFGQLTADEKRRAAKAAGDQLAAELRANADRITEVLDGVYQDDHDPEEDQPERIYQAYSAGHSAALADAQACRMIAGSPAHWRSRAHTVPDRPDERDAWMRGYGKQFAYWGGAKF